MGDPVGGAALLPIEPGTVLGATMGKLYGSSYGTVLLELQGKLYECPVMVGGLLVHDEYKGAWEAMVRSVVAPGDLVAVMVTGAYFQTESGRMPVVEVLTEGKRSLSAEALERGWALPNEYALRDMINRADYVAAVTRARALDRGIWGDAAFGGELATMLSPELLAETRAGEVPFWAHFKAPVFVLVVMVLVFIFWQRWARSFDAVAAAKRRARQERDAQRWLLTRIALHVVRGLAWTVVRNPWTYLPLRAPLEAVRRWRQRAQGSGQEGSDAKR